MMKQIHTLTALQVTAELCIENLVSVEGWLFDLDIPGGCVHSLEGVQVAPMDLYDFLAKLKEKQNAV